LNPDPSGYGQMLDFNLEPEVYSFKGLDALHRILNYREVRHYPIHIKLDSGMHRLGFQEDEMDALIPLLMREEFRVATVFTHLAASDEPAHDGFSHQQIELFDRVAAGLSEALNGSFDRHVLNAAGIERFPETPTIGNICMDMAMIDVSGKEVAEGDMVELFGKNLTVTEVARMAGTIPYEILTSIPERVKRVYLQE